MGDDFVRESVSAPSLGLVLIAEFLCCSFIFSRTSSTSSLACPADPCILLARVMLALTSYVRALTHLVPRSHVYVMYVALYHEAYLRPGSTTRQLKEGRHWGWVAWIIRDHSTVACSRLHLAGSYCYIG